MNNITENRPNVPFENIGSDIKKLISYIKKSHPGSDTLEFSDNLLDVNEARLLSISPIRYLAKVTKTSSDKIDIVVDTDDSDSFGWVKDELLEFAEIRAISKVSIHLHQLFAKPRVMQSLLEDQTSNSENLIFDKIMTKMASAENFAFLFGDGVSQPKGILSYDISDTGPAHQKIECVKSDSVANANKLIELMEKMPSKYMFSAAWLMSRNTASKLRNMRDEQTHKFLWQTSLIHGVPDTLLGYPVVICDDLQEVPKDDNRRNIPILFANLQEGYQIAEKPNINILKDPYNAKPFIEFYATKRVGGDVVNFNTIKALVIEQ